MAGASRDAAILAPSVSGNTPAEELKRLIAGLGTGEVELLSSCMIICEDTDITSVSGAILMRPTPPACPFTCRWSACQATSAFGPPATRKLVHLMAC
jgi:hypothetical protein